MSQLDLTCQTSVRCREHFQGNYTRTSERGLALGKDLTLLRARQLALGSHRDAAPGEPYRDRDLLGALDHAVWLYRQLVNMQWREMTHLVDCGIKPAVAAGPTLSLDDGTSFEDLFS